MHLINKQYNNGMIRLLSLCNNTFDNRKLYTKYAITRIVDL